MMKSAVTLCRVEAAAAGPFVFHGELEEGIAAAAGHGFDAVELFLNGADQVPASMILEITERHGLAVAAVGSGAGRISRGLTLTAGDPEVRARAGEFLDGMIQFAAQLNAPVILGSMQGSWGGEVTRDQGLEWLGDAVKKAGVLARSLGTHFLFEPLNRYESNFPNRLEDAVAWLDSIAADDSVLLLADLFHMNIEECDLAAAITAAGPRIGHVHFADSNRRAIGFGHTDAAAVMRALQGIGFEGYLSAEVLPLPNPDSAAARTIQSIHSFQSQA